MMIELTVNGKAVAIDVPPETLLVELLRDQLRLTGTHVGCDTTQCGCCVVHVDGEAIKSCTVLSAQVRGRDIVTIEGLTGNNGALHPMQAAFHEHHGLQCGYCTPGMVMMGVDIVRRNPGASKETIRRELEGNLCRCTGYQGIVNAIHTMANSSGLEGVR